MTESALRCPPSDIGCWMFDVRCWTFADASARLRASAYTGLHHAAPD
ncbi:hypothetical protein [Geminisphaera colitermitum]|nr:hypothetical protein [Geminisphaera colitermitum]